MAKKLAKTLCGLTVVMIAAGGVLAYLKMKENQDSLDEDFDDFTDEFEDQDSCAERTYTTLSRETKEQEEDQEDGTPSFEKTDETESAAEDEE